MTALAVTVLICGAFAAAAWWADRWGVRHCAGGSENGGRGVRGDEIIQRAAARDVAAPDRAKSASTRSRDMCWSISRRTDACECGKVLR